MRVREQMKRAAGSQRRQDSSAEIEMFTDRAISVRVLRRPEGGVLAGLIVVCLMFYVISPAHFLNGGLWSTLLVVATEYGVPAIGMTFLLSSGEFDLSVGGTVVLSGMLYAELATDLRWPEVVALFVGLAACACVGVVNGILTVGLKIPSFIGTLATWMFLEGIEQVVHGGIAIPVANQAGALLPLSGTVFGSQYNVMFVWFVGLVLVGAWIFEGTRYGNWIMAVGGNRSAARAAGVPVSSVKVSNFVVTSVLGGLAGLMQLGYVLEWSATTGANTSMIVILIAVVGGTSLFGGEGSVWGGFLAAILVAIIDSGLILVGAPSNWFESFVGVLLVVAVLINSRMKRGAAEVESRVERRLLSGE